MSLYLVQHGKSLPADIDPEKSLSAEGLAEVEAIASTARNNGILVSTIQHSGKKRAQQTAAILGSILQPAGGIRERTGLQPTADVIPVARELNSKDNLMLVGHLPFMERLTSFLITGTTEKAVFRFQNGGIVCLDIHPDTRTWVIKWALMPNIS